MFAVDRGYGHIARLLLEAGARADLANMQGVVVQDLAAARGNTMLKSVIDHFSNMTTVPLPSKTATPKPVKYSELDNILLALKADEYIPLFQKHKMELNHFLACNEKDLEELGIDKIGLRKSLINAISDMTKKDFEKSSMPRISFKDKQNGVYVSATGITGFCFELSTIFNFGYIFRCWPHSRQCWPPPKTTLSSRPIPEEPATGSP